MANDKYEISIPGIAKGIGDGIIGTAKVTKKLDETLPLIPKLMLYGAILGGLVYGIKSFSPKSPTSNTTYHTISTSQVEPLRNTQSLVDLV